MLNYFLKYRTVICFFMACAFPLPLLAQERLPLFETIGQVPYGYVDEQGKKTGYLYDIANLISQKAGFGPQKRLAPLKRIARNLEFGILDCTLLATTPFVRGLASVIAPIGLTLDVGIIQRAGIILNEYEDLLGLKIAVPRGVRFDEQFDTDQRLNKVASKDYKQSVLILERGRVDAIAGGIDSIRYNAFRSGFDADKLFGKPLIFSRVAIGLVCRKEIAKTPMVLRLKEAAEVLRAQGAFEKILRNYF